MKHFLISVIVATLVIPIVAARDRSPRRGAVRMFVWFLVFDLLYVAFVTLVHAVYVLPPVQ